MRIFNTLSKNETLIFPTVAKLGFLRGFSSYRNEDPKLNEFVDYLEKLKNYEKSGVPKGAGTNSDDGFDLGRMNRLLERLGNPQSKFKAVHIAGTKGKGSTAAFLSNILREEGYSVGCYTSPHLWSIRERITLGRNGDPISAEAMSCLFHQLKNTLDHSIELENGSISHFEVLTALAFSIFAQENVDIAVIEAGLGGARDATNVFTSSELAASVITTIGEEHLAALGGSLESIAMAKSGIIKHGRPSGSVSACDYDQRVLVIASINVLTRTVQTSKVVLGGPFKPYIERILRDRASSMSSPVLLASDHGKRSTIKGVIVNNGKPCQFVEICGVKLVMLGNHQLQNALSATCASLCLRNQGWKVSDGSIRSGLERTYLLGRSQFLTSEEIQAIGLSGVQVLADGAHTKESAKSLADTIQLTHPDAEVALVVAMANDKDHIAFARQLLSGKKPKVVIVTEVGIAGDHARMTSASLLHNVWIQAALELGIDFTDIGMVVEDECLVEQSVCSSKKVKHTTMLAICSSVEESIKVADRILRRGKMVDSRLIVVTGSLHIVSQALGSLQVLLK
ncbi:hypothetical protein IFM89_021374 [Coptis chinensis]|uniref:Mur ligase central domain-containing protein n=1 Tax=Coptis chinensis TaxID=261450 RepID=A0A835IDK5_9MAGN|nr:hypothetical protein IFM89_021374 [Coptis chinensis]